MPEAPRDIPASRIAVLELKDEQQLVQEGYTLLDEKRILLANEIQRRLAQLIALRRDCTALQRVARTRTISAVSRHGLDELSVYPPLSPDEDRLNVRRSRLLGLELLDVRLEFSAHPPPSRELPVNPTPEARGCAKAHRDWLARAVELAACGVNLRRLVQDYIRTERRAKAIENVLMPEIESTLKLVEEQLESIDQEEIARLRQRRGDPAGSQR
jgi:V/A-type H+-transporting ATPase subunit D